MIKRLKVMKEKTRISCTYLKYFVRSLKIYFLYFVSSLDRSSAEEGRLPAVVRTGNVQPEEGGHAVGRAAQEVSREGGHGLGGHLRT